MLNYVTEWAFVIAPNSFILILCMSNSTPWLENGTVTDVHIHISLFVYFRKVIHESFVQLESCYQESML